MYDSAALFSGGIFMIRKLMVSLSAFGVVTVVAAAPQAPAQPPATAQQAPAQGGRGAAPGQMTVWVPHTVAPEVLDADMLAKIRTEGMDHSKIMWIEHF